MKAKLKPKIYCLWGSCSLFPNCGHEDYIISGKPVVTMSLKKAKRTYPNYIFCEDWKKNTIILTRSDKLSKEVVE